MDKRTKNRLHEHSRTGHILTASETNKNIVRGQHLFKCECGWLGWLSITPEELTKINTQ